MEFFFIWHNISCWNLIINSVWTRTQNIGVVISKFLVLDFNEKKNDAKIGNNFKKVKINEFVQPVMFSENIFESSIQYRFNNFQHKQYAQKNS